jgi:DNA-binding beta-propeller fold protein YncE
MKSIVFVLAAACLSTAAMAQPAQAQAASSAAKPAAAPAFTVDAAWLKLPSQWVMGDVSAVSVDRRDNVWVLHRPRTIAQENRAKAAPPVLQFDSMGKFIRAWGGPGEGYDWPANEHSLVVDAKDRVWITGNNRVAGAADQMVLVFDTNGKFVRQIGARNASKGDLDTANFNAPADLFIDVPRRETYVADGYTNRRVIVLDSETGAFKRMWGAFGSPPPSTPPPPAPPNRRAADAPPETGDGPAEFRTVHGVELSNDGNVYVADRDNGRVQVFDRQGHYKTQVFVHRNLPSRQTAAGMGLSTDKAQRWLYVLDLGNAQLVVFDRKTLTQVAEIGGPGKAPGQFGTPHLLAVDSRGAIYIAEVSGGRVQKFTPKP